MASLHSRVSVVNLTWNRVDELVRTLDHMLALPDPLTLRNGRTQFARYWLQVRCRRPGCPAVRYRDSSHARSCSGAMPIRMQADMKKNSLSAVKKNC